MHICVYVYRGIYVCIGECTNVEKKIPERQRKRCKEAEEDEKRKNTKEDRRETHREGKKEIER